MGAKKGKVLYLDFNSEYIGSKVYAIGYYDGENKININAQALPLSWVLDYEKNVNEFIKKLPENDALTLRSAKTQFYNSVVEPLLKWVFAVEAAIKEYSVQELYVGEYYKNEIIYTYEAEGEVNKKWMYESNYYLPNLLISYLKSQHPNIEVKSIEKVGFKVLKNFYFRNIVYLTATHFLSLGRWFVRLFSKKKKKIDTNKLGLLVRNKIQSQFALYLYEYFKNEFYLLSYEQAGSFKRNYNYLHKKKCDFIDLNENISLWKLIGSYIKGLCFLFLSRDSGESLKLLDEKLCIPMGFAMRDLNIRSLDFRLFAESLSKCNNRKLISFDMLTPQAHYLAKNIGKKNIIQMQTTLIKGEAKPDFVAGNWFIYTDPVSYDQSCRNNPHFKDKFKLIDSPKSLMFKSKVEAKKKLKKVIYFSQPIEYESEEKILLALMTILTRYNIQLTVKIHPRQSLSDYDYLKRLGAIITTDVEAVLEYQLAVTRSSSIAIDCWVSGLPIVFIRETSLMKNINSNYLPSNYKGDLESIDEISKILSNYKDFVCHFEKVRESLKLEANPEHIISVIKRCFENAD